MFTRTLCASVVLALAAPCPALANETPALFHVGETMRLYHPAVPRNWRGAKLQALRTTIWYPVAATIPEAPHDIGPPGRPYFNGSPRAENAALSPARKSYPLIVMSHGTGGTADTLEWIAAPLAAAGYIVVAVDHPGNNALEPLTMDGFTFWWERATDLSEVLDGLLADPVLGKAVDRDRIGALGFSIGGYTVLELAGARTDFAAFLAFCKSPAADAICHPPEMDRVVDRPANITFSLPEQQASLARSGASYRDPRIKAIFAIAPAVGQAFAANAFADVNIPVALLAGDADTTVPPATNIRHVASLLPSASLTMLPGAGHYTFVPVCAAAMFGIMPQLCQDNPGTDRGAIHQQAVSQVEGFFAKALRGK